MLDIESELSKNLRVTRTQGVCARDRRRAPRGLATEVSSAAASLASAVRKLLTKLSICAGDGPGPLALAASE